MKNFTHKFRLISPKSIRSQYGQSVSMADAPIISSFFADTPYSLEQTEEKDDAGIYYSLSFSAVVKDSAVKSCNKQRAVLEITLSDGSVRYIGSKDAAPIFTVAPVLNSFVISMVTTLREAVDL